MAQAERLRHLRESSPKDSLLLDAGDAVGAGNITFHPGGEPILEAMSAAGYDAITVGNREFHFSKIGFETTLNRARFPVLCANIRRSRLPETPNPQPPTPNFRAELPVRPFVIHERENGLRVAIFGLTVPMITERMLSRKVSAYVFANPVMVAAELVPRLREQYKPDLLVALTHIGIQQDRLLAQTVPGIDLIVGGHTHVVLEHGEQAGETLIVQAGSHGRFVGIVEAEWDGGKLRMTARLETL